MKKLFPKLVAVKRLPQPTEQYDANELQALAESSLALGGFLQIPVVRRTAEGFEIVSGHKEIAAAHIARTINHLEGETIPVMVIEAEMEEAAAVQLETPTAPSEAPQITRKVISTPEPTEATPLPEIKRYCQERGIVPNGNKRYKSTWLAAVRGTVITTK